MNIIDQRKNQSLPVMSTKSIPVNTVFSGQIGITSSIFLRCYNVVVDLNNSQNTWETTSGIDTVSDYRPVSAMLIIREAE